MNLKFFKALFEHSIDEIYFVLNENLYNEENKKGFFVDKFIKDEIEGRFIYKKDFTELIKDPFGNDIKNNYIVYEIYNFLIDKKNNLLILFDSPRYMNVFLSSLNILFEYKITIEQLDIELSSFISFLSKEYENLDVVFLEIDGIFFSPLTSGRIIISGNENIMQYIEDATYHNSNYQIRKVIIKTLLGNKEIKIEITYKGIFKSSKKYTTVVKENIVKIVRKYFQNTR
jgi:hypothetical protein